MSFKIATLALLPALSWAQDSEQKPAEPTETRPQLERVCSAGHINCGHMVGRGGTLVTEEYSGAPPYASHAPQPVLDQNGRRIGTYQPE